MRRDRESDTMGDRTRRAKLTIIAGLIGAGTLGAIVLVTLIVPYIGGGEAQPVRVSEEREFLIAGGSTGVFEISVAGDVRSLLMSRAGVRLVGVHPHGAVMWERGQRQPTTTLATVEGGPRIEKLLQRADAEKLYVGEGSFSSNGKFALLGQFDPRDPRGRILVFWDMDATRLGTVVLPEHIQPRSISGWAPNTPTVAFYFMSESGDRADWATRRGLAVADADGSVRVLAKRSLIVGWDVGQRWWPPVWSRDGKFIYFTAGPERGMKEVSDWYSPGPYCYRVDVASGRAKFISPGDVCGIAPDGSYIILRNCPSDKLLRKPIVLKRNTTIRRESQAWKIDLRTSERTVLPEGTWVAPKLSPSGKYLAAPGGARAGEAVRIRFYGTSDWKLVGSADIDASPTPSRLRADYVWTSKSQPGQGQWSIVPLTRRPATRAGASSQQARRPGRPSGALDREMDAQAMGKR